MKKTILPLAFALLCSAHSVFAQKKFVAKVVNNDAATTMRSHFNNYSLFRINTNELASYTAQQKGAPTHFELQLPGFANWQLSITEHDILSKDYTLTVNSSSGRQVYPRPACMTFAGTLTDVNNSAVRLTIDNNTIYGLIRANEEEYFIEPLRYLDRNAPEDVFVVYNTKDVMKDPSITCGVKEMEGRQQSLQRTEGIEAGTNCVQTQLAIASDESMFIRYGSVAAVQTHNIGVMNNVIWDYVNNQFTDNIEFVIVTQNVSSSAANDQLSPAYTGTNANTILPNFRTWGQAGNFGVTYDLAQFWTTRNIDNDGAGGGAGTVGLAYVGVVCTNSRYHILEDFAGTIPSGSGSQLRVLTSHEIGHNFNCGHDAAGSTFIMAPSVNNSTTWSAASVSTVNAFVPTAVCLSACSTAGAPLSGFIGRPEAICTGGTMQLIDHSLRGPTSWSWTMTGGSPATSTIRNPTVSYATAGIKYISITSSNGVGTGTNFTKAILVSDPAAVACVNAGTSTSEAGIKSFSLNTINKTSGSANGDGNKYMDFSCSDVTSLAPSTTYTASVDVGTTVPANTFNHILFYIDYNNDGDFVDAGENVYSSGGSAYIGTISFNFTTPTTPLVTDQFLRARVIARDFGGTVTPCHNPSAGQVEDYSVFFSSPALLPATLISFEGSYQNRSSSLRWKIAEENTLSHYEIERSLNGIDFSYIGRSNRTGNGMGIYNYQYTDLLYGTSIADRYYYRLKLVNDNGRFEYSKVIGIYTNDPNAGLLVSLQPVPFQNDFSATLQLANGSSIKTELTDMMGRTVYFNERMLPAGTHTINYNGMQSLSKGMYIIKIFSNSGAVSRIIEKQ